MSLSAAARTACVNMIRSDPSLNGDPNLLSGAAGVSPFRVAHHVQQWVAHVFVTYPPLVWPPGAQCAMGERSSAGDDGSPVCRERLIPNASEGGWLLAISPEYFKSIVKCVVKRSETAPPTK